MFVRFTPNDGLLFHVDPQDIDPQGQALRTLTLQLSDTWHVMPDADVFVVVFPENMVQLEIDANDVLSVWQLQENGPEGLIYSTPIVSPQLSEEVKQQFRQGMSDLEVVYSRFAENDEENNASTIVGNQAIVMNNSNNSMNGGKRKNKKRKQTRRYKKNRTLRRSRKPTRKV